MHMMYVGCKKNFSKNTINSLHLNHHDDLSDLKAYLYFQIKVVQTDLPL